MCEFCTRHGEGKRWYLRAENYSEELRDRLKVPQATMELGSNFGMYAHFGEKTIQGINILPAFLRKIVRSFHHTLQRKFHFGQIVPIEDVEEILWLMSSVVRLPCLCRRRTIGKEERYCFGFTIDSSLNNRKSELGKMYYGNPVFHDFEFMTHEEAVNLIREYDRQGLVHSIWTINSPYIAALCNCRMDSCYALRFDQGGLKMFFRAEYVAIVDLEKCTGCGNCLRSCPFDALQYMSDSGKVVPDPVKCYGCGVCRRECPQDALSLISRNEHSAAKNIW